MAEQENEFVKKTEALGEFVCDHICKYREGKTQEEMDSICDECKLGTYMAAVEEQYQRLNNWEESQVIKLLKQKAILEAEKEELKDQLAEFRLGQML